jgi:hypothetical protein
LNRQLRVVAENEVSGDEVASMMNTLDAFDNDMYN